MNTKEAISHIEAAIDCRAFIEIKPEHYATYKKAMLEIIEMLKLFATLEQMISKFARWLNEELDPESVRDIQRYWRDLKKGLNK